MEDILVNRVAESVLTTIDLEDYLPKEPVVVFDLKPFLFMEMILKEKDFREALKIFDWSVYRDKNVTVTCSADAIIPMWAYMLIGSLLQPVARKVLYGNLTSAETSILIQNIRNINIGDFTDKRVVIKGCGDKGIGEIAYLEITILLRPIVKSIMYGEPCSTVPIFKRK